MECLKHTFSHDTKLISLTRIHSSRIRTVRCRGRLLGGSVCPGECLPRGCLPKEVCVHRPLWTEWLTDRCKNITFPQLLLRTVIKDNQENTFLGTAERETVGVWEQQQTMTTHERSCRTNSPWVGVTLWRTTDVRIMYWIISRFSIHSMLHGENGRPVN